MKGSAPTFLTVSTLTALVALVGARFGHGVVLGGGRHERRQLLGVGRVALTNLGRRHDVRIKTAHQMHLDPIVLLPLGAVFVVIPTVEGDVVKPEEAAAKSTSTALSGRLLSTIR